MHRAFFKTDYPRRPMVPTGNLLNKLGAAGNTLQGMDSGANAHYGSVDSNAFDPALILGLAKIVDARDTCPEDIDDGPTAVTAPCRSIFLYKAKFRFYDFGSLVWAGGEANDTEQNEYFLDASVHGAGQFYAKGEVVPAWADPMRGWLVPVQPKERLIGKPVADITKGTSGDVTIYLPDPEVDIQNQTGDFAVTAHTLRCLALFNDVVAGDGEGLWCECARISGRWLVGPLEC